MPMTPTTFKADPEEKQAGRDAGVRIDGLRTEEREEVRRLRREKQRLREERENLGKKATAWFAREIGPGSYRFMSANQVRFLSPSWPEYSVSP